MSSLSSTLLYTASLLSALTVAGHSKMGFDTVFPSLTKVPAGGLRDLGAGSARIGWWEVNQGFVAQGMFLDFKLATTYVWLMERDGFSLHTDVISHSLR
jgi:hypothetical protein